MFQEALILTRNYTAHMGTTSIYVIQYWIQPPDLWDKRESNPRHSDLQSDALPTELLSHTSYSSFTSIQSPSLPKNSSGIRSSCT